jgi:hypothetical protein
MIPLRFPDEFAQGVKHIPLRLPNAYLKNEKFMVK